jgi:hypothetical protein
MFGWSELLHSQKQQAFLVVKSQDRGYHKQKWQMAQLGTRLISHLHVHVTAGVDREVIVVGAQLQNGTRRALRRMRRRPTLITAFWKQASLSS